MLLFFTLKSKLVAEILHATPLKCLIVCCSKRIVLTLSYCQTYALNMLFLCPMPTQHCFACPYANTNIVLLMPTQHCFACLYANTTLFCLSLCQHNIVLPLSMATQHCFACLYANTTLFCLSLCQHNIILPAPIINSRYASCRRPDRDAFLSVSAS